MYDLLLIMYKYMQVTEYLHPLLVQLDKVHLKYYQHCYQNSLLNPQDSMFHKPALFIFYRI